MNDTPGWASPGSAPPDGHKPGASDPAEPADRPETANPAQQPQNDPQDADSKWSQQQPPPGQWSAPTGPAAPGQTPPPPPPGPGWGSQPPAGPPPPGRTPPPPPPGRGGGPQPPAGPPGGYVPPPGWGGGYGGWGGPPPAAKPGVIPLRPLGGGEILDGAVSTMRTYWRTVLGISLTVAVVTEVLVILLQGFVLNDSAGTEA